jgi:anti-sigma factor RsiW
MRSQRETQQINAFVDGELELTGQLEIEERMRSDPALREEVDALRQLRAALRERAEYHAAPAGLRARIAALATPAATPAPPPATRRAPAVVGAAIWRWLGSHPMAASFGLVAALALALNLAWLRSAQDERLLDEVVASHVRATLGQHLVDVASSDHHTVKPWLSSKLDFSPPVSELPIPGSVFLGGRVDYLDGRPVAALVYRQGQHVVNAFVWPGGTTDSRVKFAAERGFQTAHWSHGGMNHWVISDVNPREFATIVQAIQRADGPVTTR